MYNLKIQKQIELRDTVVEALIIIRYPTTGNLTYYVREPTKRRRRIRLGTSNDLTLKQARKRASELSIIDCPPAFRTLSQVFEAYAKSGEHSGKRSLEQERKRFERSVEPILGSKSITAIGVNDVQAVMAGLNSSLSDATRNRYLAMLRSIFRFSIINGFSDKDPSRSIKLRREVPVKLYEITDEFIGHLRGAVRWLQKTIRILRAWSSCCCLRACVLVRRSPCSGATLTFRHGKSLSGEPNPEKSGMSPSVMTV